MFCMFFFLSLLLLLQIKHEAMEWECLLAWLLCLFHHTHTHTSRFYFLLSAFDLEIFIKIAKDCYAMLVYIKKIYVNHRSINLPDDTFMSTHLLCVSHCDIRLIKLNILIIFCACSWNFFCQSSAIKTKHFKII